MSRWYIIIPHLQAPLQIDASISNIQEKSAVFFMTPVAALKEAELLCAVVLGSGTGTIIPPQAPLPRICPGT